jgi:hypothetical protein
VRPIDVNTAGRNNILRQMECRLFLHWLSHGFFNSMIKKEIYGWHGNCFDVLQPVAGDFQQQLVTTDLTKGETSCSWHGKNSQLQPP